jgi:hypothetical protein
MINKSLLLLLATFLFIAQGPAKASGVGGGGGGDRPVTVAYAEACERGPYFYQMEEDDSAPRPVLRSILYICVNGIYRKNGYVPKYPRCTEGESKLLKEWQTYGNHDREVNVRYTCVNGILKRNP